MTLRNHRYGRDSLSRRLAKASDGVLLDLQTDEVWPKPRVVVERVSVAEEPINMVEARFYFLIDEAPTDLPARYLAIARRHLPEALPANYSWSGN